MTSLSSSRILKYDPSKFMKFLENFPENAKFAFETSLKTFKGIKLGKDYKRFAFFGMGGSGISANIVQGLFPDIDIRVFKDYYLPKYVDDNYFCIAISYSGNTEETLSVLRQAKRRGLKYLAVYSGGKMSEMNHPEGCYSITVPPEIIPRLTLPHMFFSILGFLQIFDGFKMERESAEAFRVLENLKENLVFHNSENNPGKEIAENIKGKIPIIYGFGPYIPVAMRAKEQFNENAKIPAFFEIMPNADHNAVTGWTSKKLNKHITALVIRDKNGESEEMKKRLDATINIMKKTASNVIEIRPIGKSMLARVFSLIYIIDYVSFYLGLLNKVDPADTSIIENLKKDIKK